MRWRRARRKTFDSPPRPIDAMWQDMVNGLSGAAVSRADALSVPAVQRGRNMLCAIATLPLELVDRAQVAQESPLLAQLDPDVPNVVTLAQTVEDLVFDGISWWLVTAQDFAGYPVAVRHLDVGQVSLQPPNGRGNPAPLPSGADPRGAAVWVDGQPVAADRIIRFDSPNPAVCKVSGRPIRRAILLDRAAGLYADDPRPLDYFEPADGADTLEDEEVRDVLNQWRAARKQRTTAYIPASLKYATVDAPSPQQLQLVELSRQAGLDIANALGVDPEDLGISTTSRTYANDVDRRRNKLNEVLGPYMRALTDRLTMGDVTRRGYRVRFSVAEYLMPNPGERWSIYSTAVGLGAMTVDEVRSTEGMGPLPPAAATDPASSPAEDGEPAGSSTQEDDPAVLSTTAGHTFDGPPVTMTADMPLASFSVNREGRVIEGLAVPWRAVSHAGGVAYRFERGSLQWDAANPGRVKLLRDHETGRPLGTAVALRDTPSGLLARFRVARGAEGDEALSLAEDGVLDGLSIGVDFNAAEDATEGRDGVMRVQRADLREVSLTAMPAFDGARVTTVAASRTGEPMGPDDEPTPVPEQPPTPETPETPPDPQPAVFTAEQVTAMLSARLTPETPPAAPARPVVDPTRRLNLAVTREDLPYRFDRGGNFVPTEHVFSADLHEMARARDNDGTGTPAGRRVMELMRRTFADVMTDDINELTPGIQRPDMYVDQADYRYPIWQAIDKGAPPNGVQPFIFPKFSSAASLVGDHTEGTEPASGSFVTTSQTVTPTAISGKASITREVWDMGGNPAVSTLIFNQMVRGWREGLETAAATFLNTLTAATDITLTTAAVDDALASSLYAALAGLQFVRGYDFSVFVLEQVLYKQFVDAVDGDARPLFPMIGPSNANGTVAPRFRTLDLGGYAGIPSWALASTPGSANNSWLFDPMFVHGWASTPQRLEFPGTDQSDGSYAPVAMVDIAIWGYKALANSDIGAVRQVIYDSVS